MSKTLPRPGIVVCGFAAAERLTIFARSYIDPPPIYFRHSADLLLDALKAWQHPLCIIEHEHMTLDLGGWDGHGEPPLPKLPSEQGMMAYDIIPRLIEVSPATRYWVTSHTRGSGVGRDRAIYKNIAQVERVLGFLNSAAAYKQLSAFVNRRWGCAVKSEEQYYKEFCERQEAMQRLSRELEQRRNDRT